MTKEQIIRFFVQRKVYLTVGAFLLLGILILGFGMSTDEAKAWIENVWSWTQGF